MSRLFRHDNDLILAVAPFEMAVATASLALISDPENAPVVERSIRERGERTTPELLQAQIRSDICDDKRRECLHQAKQGDPEERKRAILMASMNVACMIRRNLGNYGCGELYARVRAEKFKAHAPRLLAKLFRACDPNLFADIVQPGGAGRTMDASREFLSWAGDWFADFILSEHGRDVHDLFYSYVDAAGARFAYEGRDGAESADLERGFVAARNRLGRMLRVVAAVVCVFQEGVRGAVADMFGRERAEALCASRPDAGLNLMVMTPDKLFSGLVLARLPDIFLNARHYHVSRKKEVLYVIEKDCGNLLGDGVGEAACASGLGDLAGRVAEACPDVDTARKVAVMASRRLRERLFSLPDSMPACAKADAHPEPESVRLWVKDYIGLRFLAHVLERREAFCASCKQGFHGAIADEKIVSVEADGHFVSSGKLFPAKVLKIGFNLSLMAYYFFHVPEEAPRSGPAKKKHLADAEARVLDFLGFILSPDKVFFSMPMFLRVLGEVSLNAVYDRKLPRLHPGETDEGIQARLLKKFVISNYLMPDAGELSGFTPDTANLLLRESYKLLQRMPFENLLKLKAIRDKKPGYYVAKLIVMLKESAARPGAA